ncbi:MAG: SDR family oxidoreductase [Leptospiraceae bacterium]|nr:SDR family oxidoreductase [Leptospiraceae bacterium]
MAQKHALVTGGAGFIGAHLVRALIARGFRVTVWDNLHTGRKKNLEGLGDAVFFDNIDIRDSKAASLETLKHGKPDVIFNLACPASPPHYQKDPIYTWETSVLGVRNLLFLAESCGAMLLHASTSEIYGDPQVHPQPESYWGNVNPIGVRSCYDEGKRAAETLCADYRRHKNLDVRIFRIFNTYGEFMHPDDGRVISNFCVAALTQKPLPVYGSGQQTRSFCYVSDLVEGILLLAQLPRELYDGPVNLGNPGEFTILELVKLLEKILGRTLAIEYHPLPADDPKMRRPDISRAKSLLGWQPQVMLEEGLRRTLEYFAAELGVSYG